MKWFVGVGVNLICGVNFYSQNIFTITLFLFCVSVCVCYDDLGDKAIGSTKPDPSETTEEHVESKKVDPVKEEKPPRQGTQIKGTAGYLLK